MNLARLSVLLLFLVFFTNCNKDDQPLPQITKEDPSPEPSNNETYFKYTVPSFMFGYSSTWIIIHDSTGSLVDYKSLEGNSVVEFTATKGTAPENFTVTTLRATDNNTQAFYFLNSYTDIKKGSIWYEDYFENDTKTVSSEGIFDVQVKNIPGVERLNVSTPNGIINNINENLITESDGSNTLRLNDVLFYENNDYLISIYDTNGNLKYARINPEKSEKLELDYSKFDEFDSYLDVELPKAGEFWIYTAGYLEEKPNYFSSLAFTEFGQSLNRGYSSSSVYAGYLDFFTKHKTEFSVDFSDYNYGYSVNGPKVEEISILDKPTVEITNDGLQNFEFNTNQNFIRKVEEWFYKAKNETTNLSVLTHWFIYSKIENRSPIGDLPEEILEKHTFLDPAGTSLKSLSLYPQSETYDEWLNINKVTLEEKNDGIKEYLRVKF